MATFLTPSDRDARAVELAGFDPTADELALAYEHVDAQDADAGRRAQASRLTLRVREILGAKHGQSGQPSREEVAAAYARAGRELGVTRLTDTLTRAEVEAAAYARAVTRLAGEGVHNPSQEQLGAAMEDAERELRAS